MRLNGLCLRLAVHSHSELGQPADVVCVGDDDEIEVGVGFPVGKILPLPTDDNGDYPWNLWVVIMVSMYV